MFNEAARLSLLLGRVGIESIMHAKHNALTGVPLLDNLTILILGVEL
jgi:hypothetical protein